MIYFHYLNIYLHFFLFFFFNDTATTEIYTLSLHDALPISPLRRPLCCATCAWSKSCAPRASASCERRTRSDAESSATFTTGRSNDWSPCPCRSDARVLLQIEPTRCRSRSWLALKASCALRWPSYVSLHMAFIRRSSLRAGWSPRYALSPTDLRYQLRWTSPCRGGRQSPPRRL